VILLGRDVYQLPSPKLFIMFLSRKLHGYIFRPLCGNLQVTKIRNIKTKLPFYFCVDKIRSQSVGVIRIVICNTQEGRSQSNHENDSVIVIVMLCI